VRRARRRRRAAERETAAMVPVGTPVGWERVPEMVGVGDEAGTGEDVGDEREGGVLVGGRDVGRGVGKKDDVDGLRAR
jgi:hypothetical protein